MTMQELQYATSQDEHSQHLQEYITRGWPENRDHIPQNMRTYWMFQDDMAVIDGVILKGRCIVIPESLQRQTLEQLNVNHLGIYKTKHLGRESSY